MVPSVGSASASADFCKCKPTRIGNNYGNTNGWNGYIDGLRVYKGQALHTGNLPSILQQKQLEMQTQN